MAVLPIGTATTAFLPISNARPIAPAPAGADGFGDMLSKGIANVTAAQEHASTLAGQVATGQLTDIHEFTTAAAKASLGVSLTSTVRNRAVEAYQEIMRMQV